MKNSTIRSVKLNDAMIRAARLAVKTARVVKPAQLATTPGERRSIRLEQKALVEIARIKKENRDAEYAAETDNTKPEAQNDAQEDTKKQAQDKTMNQVEDDSKTEVQGDMKKHSRLHPRSYQSQKKRSSKSLRRSVSHLLRTAFAMLRATKP